MAGRRQKDDFEQLEDSDRSEGWVDDVAPDDVWLTPVDRGSTRLGRRGGVDQRDRGWRLARRKRPAGDVQAAETSPTTTSETEHPASLGGSRGEFARIGRRGLLRPELLALAAGAVFILAALVKPWPHSTTAALVARASATAAPSSAASSAGLPIPSALPTAGSTVDLYALIPPYNYRPGQWPPPAFTSPGNGSAWASVDWSFLNVLDGHPSWGVAAITLPSQPPEQQPASPDISWVEEVAPWHPSEVLVPRGSSTYALAITWPAGIRVDSISFDYLSYDSPKVGVTPVPAAAVATPAPSEPGAETPPTATPRATATPRPGARSIPTKVLLSTMPPNSGTMISGAFWIPPSGDLTAPAPQSVRTAWQAAPWVWPLGSYRVTLDTNAGQMIVAIQLRQI